MRIGLIAPPWLPVPPPRYGGTEEVVDVLARGLQHQGHDVRLVTTGDARCEVPRAFIYEHAERDRLGATIPEFYHALYAYESLRDRDVIHDHTVAGLYVAAALGLPAVVTTNHGPFTTELQAIYRGVQDHVAIVAISHDQASQAGAARVARVIHHGLDRHEFPFGPGDGGYLLFLGRMNPDKGVHIAARVARAAGRRLLIAAKMQEPPERRYFTDEVEPLLSDEVVYVGEVDREEKKRLLAGATALLNPIQWPEPFGLVMIEALASGTPVIALPRGAAPEIVQPGVSGFLCETEDEMVEAVERVGEIDREACRARFEAHFTAERMVQDHLDLYATMIAPDLPRAAAVG